MKFSFLAVFATAIKSSLWEGLYSLEPNDSKDTPKTFTFFSIALAKIFSYVFWVPSAHQWWSYSFIINRSTL